MLPWATVVQPLATQRVHYDENETKNLLSKTSDKRCNFCGGFINCHCKLLAEESAWICSLCQKKNVGKFTKIPDASTVVYNIKSKQANKRVVYLSLVDETGDINFINHIRTSIAAALQGLPDAAWFGKL